MKEIKKMRTRLDSYEWTRIMTNHQMAQHANHHAMRHQRASEDNDDLYDCCLISLLLYLETTDRVVERRLNRGYYRSRSDK